MGVEFPVPQLNGRKVSGNGNQRGGRISQRPQGTYQSEETAGASREDPVNRTLAVGKPHQRTLGRGRLDRVVQVKYDSWLGPA